MLNGDAILVDNEGSAQGANRTTQTIPRTGVATAVGAAGGAGSVVVPGKDNLELPSGTELTIRSSGPR
jgi:hypothetical protein